MWCSLCKTEKDSSQFVSINSKTGKQKVTLRCSDCRSKRRDYYYNNKDYFDRVNKVARITHKDAIVRRNKIYQQNNKDRTAKWHQNKESKLKNKFLCMYGGKCQCCGESEEVFFVLRPHQRPSREEEKRGICYRS